MWNESQVLPATTWTEPSVCPNAADPLHIQGELNKESYANTTMRINHMFVSLRIAMCQTFTGEKQLSGQIRVKNQ